MADSGTIEIKGIEERIKQFGEASTKNPQMEKRIREVIRAVLAKVRKSLQGQARTGLQMEDDPRSAYKAVRMAVYRRIFGGQVNILQSKSTRKGRYYEPPRHPSRRGGNRMKQSDETRRRMSYEGAERGFILRFLNAGTQGRYALHGRNSSAHEDYESYILRTGGQGWRGRIMPRNWFGSASQRELENAARNIDRMIDKIIQGIMY